MIGFIGGLFAGVFGLFDKVLPGNKKDYAVTFDDAVPTVETTTETATEKPAPAKEAVKSEKPKTEAKTQKRPTAKSEKKAQAAAKAQPKTPAAATNGKVSTKPAGPVELFAPNYLLPKPTARRRRPGANMAAFVQMSRDMNIRP